jgi:hypothetical protein
MFMAPLFVGLSIYRKRDLLPDGLDTTSLYMLPDIVPEVRKKSILGIYLRLHYSIKEESSRSATTPHRYTRAFV